MKSIIPNKTELQYRSYTYIDNKNENMFDRQMNVLQDRNRNTCQFILDFYMTEMFYKLLKVI